MFKVRDRVASRRAKGADDGFDPEEKPFLDHLEDLRVMFFKMIVALTVGIVGCFVFKQQLMDAIRMPMVWADVAEPDALKAIFDFRGEAGTGRFGVGDLVVTQGGFLARVVEEDTGKGLTIAEVSEGVRLRFKTESIVGKVEAEEDKIARGDLQRLAKQNILIMETFAPHEGLMIVLKLAFFSALVVTFPFLMWFGMEFVWPGLRQQEKMATLPAMFVGFVLFLTGATFAFRVGLPFALRFLSEWNYEHGMNPGWRVGYYMQFVTQVTLVFGLAFQIPVGVMVLVKLELLTYRSMRESRSYAIVILLVLAAFLTPPDPMTLVLLGGPLIVLYEICIWMAWFMERKRRKLEAAEEKRRAQERAEWEERRARLVAEGKLPGEGAAGEAGKGPNGSGEPESGLELSHERDLYQEGSGNEAPLDDPYHGHYDEHQDHDWHHHHHGGGVASKLIDINHATLEELQKLPGIGPKLAQQILEARPFYSAEELEYHAFLPPSVVKLVRDRVTFY